MATRKRSNSSEDPSPKAKVKTRPFILESMELDPNITDEDEQEPKEKFYTVDDNYLDSNPFLFQLMNFNLLGPYEFTSALGHQIESHGGALNEWGTKIAPSLQWIRDNNFPDSEVLLKFFIEDSIKNNKLED